MEYEYGHIRLCEVSDCGDNHRLKDLSICEEHVHSITDLTVRGEDFFDTSPLQVMCICQLSYSQYVTLRNRISSHIAPPPCNVLSMYSSHLPTKVPSLDNCLSGGLIPGTITEICGPPGSGKTQFCMTMATYCCMPTNNGGLGLKTIYIDTEGSFTAHRVLQIAKHHCSTNTDKAIQHVANNIIIYTELTCDSLDKRLTDIERSLTTNNGCGLLCLDSLASLLRKEYDTRTVNGLADRSTTLSFYATRLKWLAEKYKLVVIVTNQIVITIPKGQSDSSSNVGGVVSASLGNTWFHCVNIRLMLKMKDVATGTRTLQIVKCPSSSNDIVTVRVGTGGFV